MEHSASRGFACTDNPHKAVKMATEQVQGPKRDARGWYIETWDQSSLSWKTSVYLTTQPNALRLLRAERYRRAMQLLGVPILTADDSVSWSQRVLADYAVFETSELVDP